MAVGEGYKFSPNRRVNSVRPECLTCNEEVRSSNLLPGPMNKWTLLHRYQHLTRLGLARAFLCPECEHEVKFLPDNNDEPVLWCPWDDNAFVPGAMFWGDVNSVVTEYYV